MVHLRDVKVIAKFCESGKARCIVFKHIWNDTVRHDKMPANNNFGWEMRALSINFGNTVRSKP